MRRIAFYTLGCKVNQADTASMEAIFKASGYKVVGFNEDADVYLVNTCVVTNTGQRKSRQIINRAVRCNPLALTVVLAVILRLLLRRYVLLMVLMLSLATKSVDVL